MARRCSNGADSLARGDAATGVACGVIFAGVICGEILDNEFTRCAGRAWRSHGEGRRGQNRLGRLVIDMPRAWFMIVHIEPSGGLMENTSPPAAGKIAGRRVEA